MASFPLRAPDDLMERVRALAPTENRSMNNMIQVLLEEALAARPPVRKSKGKSK